ncbi:MAG: hypothetical protein ACRC33_25635 [Gemmataceae bacterium]
MTLDELLLERLADWRPDSTRPALTVDHDAAGWRVQLTADTVDSVGARLRALEVRRLRPLDEALPLADQAARLAATVTGLLEPLKVLELDAGRGVAQLRSTAPAKQGEALRYYEVLRHADGSTYLHRYQGGAGPRAAVDFTLTHDALAKLVRDFAG